MPRKRRSKLVKDSFWPEVRRRMREKAIELYMIEHSRNPYFTGQTLRKLVEHVFNQPLTDFLKLFHDYIVP